MAASPPAPSIAELAALDDDQLRAHLRALSPAQRRQLETRLDEAEDALRAHDASAALVADDDAA